MYYMVLFFLMMFSGLFVFCSMHKHLLLTLLSLEFLSLSLYYLLFIFVSFFSLSYYFILVFLTFSVCEAVLGLAVLVSMIRSHGNDYVSGVSILGW